jgi:CubicO group peptidase (beta-lactamase class C family)
MISSISITDLAENPYEENLLMRRTRLFTILTLFLVSLTYVPSVPAQSIAVDQWVKTEMQKQNIPGLSLAVVKEGKVIKAQGYGLANVEHNIAATADSVYKIGSVSKQFLATGIMLLYDEGKLSLDDKISKYLEGTPETWKDITLRHLLTHTSGIVREAPGFDPFKVQADADVIKTAYNQPLRFAPGEKWEYCNVGYFSLAEIIHKVSGKPWAEFMTERFFAPLGMTATRTTTETDIVMNRADGYVWKDNKFSNAQSFFALRPSGAFLSSVVDLAKWEAALYASKPLKPATFELMWTPVKLNDGKTHPYGFGWELDAVQNHKRVHHGGSLPGFRSQYARFVNDKITVIVLTNLDGGNPAAIAVGVAGFYIPDLAPSAGAVK